MDKKIDWETLSFQIITKSGEAKHKAMEALNLAKKNSFDESLKAIKEANVLMGHASSKHFDVITKEANGEKLDFKLLFIHAEDQLLTTQTLILVIQELIEVYKKISK